MIELRNVHRSYRMGTVNVHALRGASLRIEAGESVAIMGPSGSGKSTLMHIIGLLDSPDHGDYLLGDRNVSDLSESDLADLRAQWIGFVFQQFNLLPRLSARENVSLPRIYANGRAHVPVDELLRQVGLGDRMKHAPNELSGGQQQRVAIARAMVNRPRIILADEPTGNLDSSSSHEIMRILLDLHASGMTLILVTHDSEVAAMAARVVTLRDGRVLSDVRRSPAMPDMHGEAASDGRPPERGEDRVSVSMEDAKPPAPAESLFGRKLKEAGAMVREASRALFANKTRTFLSMLGVMIGVGAVIAMMAVGGGAKQAVEERIASMGANLFVLRPGSVVRGGVAGEAGATSRLKPADAEAIAAGVSLIARTAPIVNGQAQTTYGAKNWRTQILGTSPSYCEMHARPPYFGRFFTTAEVDSQARVAVIGTTLVKELFADANPVGKTMRINRTSFEVIGVLQESSADFRRDPNDQIMVPVTTAMKRLLGRPYLNSIEMQAAEGVAIEDAKNAVVDFMIARKGIPAGHREAFQIFDMSEIQATMAATSKTMSALLASIGIVSLLVGGIGIMNIMLVSVTERTREIGIRKAVGAKWTDILAQFLIEAIVISAWGGVLGILLGWGSARAMSHFAGWTTVMSIRTMVIAFSFSALVGIVFGLWPAHKASRLKPIDALRYE